MQPDQDRLRAELEKLYNESRKMGMLRTGSPITHMVDGALALIAREVRLGKIEELKGLPYENISATNYKTKTFSISSEWVAWSTIANRITELEKE